MRCDHAPSPAEMFNEPTVCLRQWSRVFLVLPVYSGVSQGIILGPLLFLVYLNDTPTAISCCKAYLFADDTKFIKRIIDEDNMVKLQRDMNTLHQWSEKWLLSL